VVEVTSVGVRSFEYRIISVSLSPRRERGRDVGRGPAALGVCSRRVSPVSAGHSKIVYDALKACGIRVMSALPETWLVHLIRMAEDDPDVTLVRLAKEEEGVGISAGAHLAGVKSAMLMQNHGFLAAVNGIVSCAQLYRIPLLMLISYRGTFGERDPWQTEGGGVTEDVLKALRIPYLLLDDPAHVARRINQAQTLAQSSNKPVALLLCRDLMWEEPS
jgi:sulfopyruvate decarboxylase subunit alpha